MHLTHQEILKNHSHSIEKLMISGAQPNNLEMFVEKTIKLIQLKFDMKKFKEYLDVMKQSINQSRESLGRLTDPQNPGLGKIKIPAIAIQGNFSYVAKVIEGKLHSELKGQLENSQSEQIQKLMKPMILGQIFAFLQQPERNEFQSLCKLSYETTRKMRKTMSLCQNLILPASVFKILVNRFDRIVELDIGRAKDFKPEPHDFEEIRLNQLRKLDLSKMSNVTVKVIQILLKIAPNLRELYLPYYQMSTSSIYQIKNDLNNLAKFKMKKHFSDGPSIYLNRNLNDSSISSVWENNPQLVKFQVYSIDARYFERMADAIQMHDPIEKYQRNLHSLRFDVIKFRDEKELQKIAFIEKLYNLRTLVLGKFVYYDESEQCCKPQIKFNIEDVSEVLLRVIQNLKQLKKLHIGNWADNKLVKAMTPSLSGLEDLRINSEIITCESLNDVFEKCHQLRRLDFKDCFYFDVEPFLNLKDGQRLEQIKVRFDDYRVNQLKGVLQSKKIFGCRIINYGK